MLCHRPAYFGMMGQCHIALRRLPISTSDHRRLRLNCNRAGMKEARQALPRDMQLPPSSHESNRIFMSKPLMLSSTSALQVSASEQISAQHRIARKDCDAIWLRHGKFSGGGASLFKKPLMLTTSPSKSWTPPAARPLLGSPISSGTETGSYKLSY